jgi:CRISPR type III-B/RAMP module-associated protein Cmr3
MKTLFLTPQDTLFFRDGRPMEGALAGHTAAWCPPHVVNYAFHAALHRAGLDSHKHHSGISKNRDYSSERNQSFGSLLTVGPFPVDAKGNWYFPAPADLAKDNGTVKIAMLPMKSENQSSLPEPLTHSLASVLPPAKDSAPGNWLRADAWGKYLRGENLRPDDFIADSDFGDFEASIGIGINPETGTQDGESFYSAHYLRLKDDWRLGVDVSANDKEFGDLIEKLLPEERLIVVGGQQRICTIKEAEKAMPFPQMDMELSECCCVKWVLLSPAVFPEIGGHRGGWLPNWIDAKSGEVMLKQSVERKRPGESRVDWRARVETAGSIDAKLIAAKIGNPVPISGWKLQTGSAKPTQLSVPAGSVYYFQCGTPEAAKQLARVLNYPNRRSTLWGEKGYGIGICSSFNLKQN